MARNKPSDPKIHALAEQGCLNPRPQDVDDLLFAQDPFFDPCDLVQVKYEMLRRVLDDGLSVTAAATAFGFSRPTFYQAQEAFEQQGLPGLVPRKRGPRGGHKLTDEVVAFLLEQIRREGDLPAGALAHRVAEHFGVVVHPRSVERALERHKKNAGRAQPPFRRRGGLLRVHTEIRGSASCPSRGRLGRARSGAAVAPGHGGVDAGDSH